MASFRWIRWIAEENSGRFVFGAIYSVLGTFARKMTSNVQRNPEDATRQPKAPPRDATGAPRTAKGSPRAPRREPKGAQGHPKESQRAPKSPQREPKRPLAPGACRTQGLTDPGWRVSGGSAGSTHEFEMTHFWFVLLYLVTRMTLRCNVLLTVSYPLS